MIKEIRLQDLELLTDQKNGTTEELIEEITTSGIKFRSALDNLIFLKIYNFFANKGIRISKETNLNEIFPKKGREIIWADFKNFLPLKVPSLHYHPIVFILIFSSVIFSIGWSVNFVFKHQELLLLTMGVSLSKILIPFLIIPTALFATIFNPFHLRWKTVEELIDKIIDKNFRDLLADKSYFKKILKEELENQTRL